MYIASSNILNTFQDFFDDAEVDEKEEAEKRKQREKDMDKKLLKKIRDAEAAAKIAAEKAPNGDQIFEQDLVTLRVTLIRVCILPFHPDDRDMNSIIVKLVVCVLKKNIVNRLNFCRRT